MLLSHLDDAPMDWPVLKSQEKPIPKENVLPNPRFFPIPSSKLSLRCSKGFFLTWKLPAEIPSVEKLENSRSFLGKPQKLRN